MTLMFDNIVSLSILLGSATLAVYVFIGVPVAK